MKNIILSIAFVLSIVLGTTNTASAGTTSKVVVITSGLTAAKSGLLKNLTTGSMRFDSSTKTFMVIPVENTDKGIANLVAEIKTKLPDAQLKTVELTSDKK